MLPLWLISATCRLVIMTANHPSTWAGCSVGMSSRQCRPPTRPWTCCGTSARLGSCHREKSTSAISAPLLKLFMLIEMESSDCWAQQKYGCFPRKARASALRRQLREMKSRLLFLRSSTLPCVVFAVPDLIYHYGQTHHYKPLDRFLCALKEGALPPSQEYFELLKKFDPEWATK